MKSTPAQAPGNNSHRFQWRNNAGRDTADANTGGTPAYPNNWQRLRRTGNWFVGYTSTNGVDWQLQGSQNTATWPTGPMGEAVYLGLAVVSHRDGGQTTNSALSLGAFREYQNTPASEVTPIVITRQPSNVRVLAGTSATLSVNVNEPWNFQWLRNGQEIPGATGSTYTIDTVGSQDVGVNYSVRITNARGSVVSSNATISIGNEVFGLGFLKWERYAGQGTGSTNGTTLQGVRPDETRFLTSFEAPADVADNFAARITGFFVPPTTGDYVFFLAADDQSVLYLSTDENPANKYAVAMEPRWAARRQWNSDFGSGTDAGTLRTNITGLEGKRVNRSDQFLGRNIALEANKRYYIEGIYAEGGGGDHMAATYKLASEADPANGSATRISGDLIGTLTVDGAIVSFVTQPTNTTAEVGTSATFVAVVDANSVTGLQWFRVSGGQTNEVAGATSATFTTPLLTTADNNAQYFLRVRFPGGTTNSARVTLTVSNPGHGPVVKSIGALNKQEITVAFDRLIGGAATNAANYTVAGATVASVRIPVLSESNVVLTLAAPVTGNSAEVTVKRDVTSFGGNRLTNDHTATVNFRYNLRHQDVGTPGDPNMPGDAISPDSNIIEVTAGGTDIWNNQDGFHYAYESKTGNFDVQVRMHSVVPVNQWSAGALMVRDTTNATSRNWHIKQTPRNTTTRDNSGSGANSVEANRRANAGQATANFAENAANTGSNPNYPNAWMRIARTNQVISVFRSDDGITWAHRANDDVSSTSTDGPLPDTVLVGLATTSHNNGVGLNWMTTVVYSDYGPYDPNKPADAVLTFSYNRANNQLTIGGIAAGFVLESADTVTGPWTAVTGVTGTSMTVNATAAAKFYRLRKQ
jgi:hypothetical protein